MKASFFLLAACVASVSAVSAQTTPTLPAPPATMAAPNVARTDMSTAAEGTAPVSTDYTMGKRKQARDGQPKMKTKKTKSTLSDGTGKVKTKM